jgi:hypothetical protein
LRGRTWKLTTKPLFLLLLLLFIAPCGADGSDPRPCPPASVPKDTNSPIKKPQTPLEQLNVYCGANNASSVINNPTPQPPETITKHFSIDDWLHTFQMLAIIVGGGWALIIYWKNSRTKTIETLITLEQEYKKYLPFLLKIETSYHTDIKPALEREASSHPTEEDKKILRQLDGVLRHFYVCLQARKLGVVNRKVLDEMCAYHLKMLCGSLEKPNKVERKELADYVYKYWISIFRWAEKLPTFPR